MGESNDEYAGVETADVQCAYAAAHPFMVCLSQSTWIRHEMQFLV